jgi:hypothetical protein
MSQGVANTAILALGMGIYAGGLLVHPSPSAITTSNYENEIENTGTNMVYHRYEKICKIRCRYLHDARLAPAARGR